MFSYFEPAGRYLAPYLSEISVAMIACLLVVFGADINALLRRVLRNQAFVIRTLAFILINAFGYGLAIVKLTPYLARTLVHMEKGMMFTLVVFSFIIIGLWAQRNRQI